MIAEDFLQLRATIGTELLVLSHHAREAGAGERVLEKIESLGAILREPLRLVMLGPAGAGKSALINALAGSVLAGGGKSLVDHFDFGPHKLDESAGSVITRHQRPLALLRDIQFVDTAGCEHLGEQLEMIAARFLRASDAVLFVLPADDPFAAAAWSFAARLVRLKLPGIVFVLNKCDTLEDAEVAPLVSRVEGKAASAFGAKSSVVAVSAKDAMSADPETRSGSGLAGLEQVIGTQVARNDARRAKLRSVCATARGIARDFIERTQENCKTLKAGAGRLSDLDARLNESTNELSRQADAMVWGVSQFYDRSLKRVENWLIGKLALPKVFQLAFRSPEFDVADEIDVNLRASIERHVRKSVGVLDEDLKGEWTRMHEALSCELGGGEKLPAGCALSINEGNALLERLDRALQSAVTSPEVAKAMLGPMAVLGRRLRVPLVAVLAGLITSLLGFMAGLAAGWHQWKTAMAAGGVISLGAVAVVWMLTVSQGSRLSVDLRAKMDAQRERVLRTIEEHLRASIRQFHGRLRDSLDAVIGFKTAQEMLVIEPVETQLAQAAAVLAGCESRLGPPVGHG